MIHKLKTWWKRWRLKPGLTLAAQEAYNLAWRNKNSWALGPELNLLNFSTHLHNLQKQDQQ